MYMNDGNKTKINLRNKSVQTSFLQTHVIVVVHVIQTHDLDTLYGRQQSLCKVRADKTSYTRDENALV